MRQKISAFTLTIVLTALITLVYASGHLCLKSLSELIALTAIVSLIKNKTIKCVLYVLYMLIFSLQMASVLSTGTFMIPMTLANIGEFHAIGTREILKASACFFTFLILGIISRGSFFTALHFKRKYLNSITLLVGGLVIAISHGPIIDFTRTVKIYVKQMLYCPHPSLKEAKKYLKPYFSHEKIPEALLSQHENVIVIFTEGLSSRIIDGNNDKNLSLTPNIDHLLKQSLVFRHYYNHTAATFRGLRGQLLSTYQYKGGYSSSNDGIGQISKEALMKEYRGRLISLPHILNAKGYQTYFIASTEKNANLTVMLRALDFTRVYGMGDFEGYQSDRMTDKQTFSALIKWLQSGNHSRFFMGVYPSGTHHGLDSPDEKYGDGSNSYLNKFYNYDKQLGIFLQYFMHSPYQKNTLLIITADHATFPTKEYRDSFDTDAKYFVDEIPLIIYKAGIKSQLLDAHDNNSLDLAPTILNLLGIEKGKNYFLGCSLFDTQCNSEFSHTSAIGDALYSTDHNTITEIKSTRIHQNPIYEDMWHVYDLSG